MSCRPNHWTTWFGLLISSRPPAGDVEYRAGGERAVLAREPAHERRDLVHVDEAVHRDLRQHVVDVLLGHLVEDRGLRRRRRHAVHQHAGLRASLPRRLGQRDHARLGGRVGHRVRVAFLAGDRSDVDDAAVARLHHVRRDRAAAQELAGEVDAQHALPFLDRVVDRRRVHAGDAGVVDQHVDLAELPRGPCRPRRVGNVDLRRAVEIPDRTRAPEAAAVPRSRRRCLARRR